MSSPLQKRTSAQPLTLELLREHVPAVRDGYAAKTTLAAGEENLSREERRRLLEARNRGQRAQWILIDSASPLIRNIATREFQRRRGWNSRVSYDDVLQEATIGFIRGLLSPSYDVNSKSGNSATNYLGQWVTSTIRRKIEVMEHDFSIPYEVIERGRRIKAVRSRLASELGREPSDEELLTGLNAAEQYNTGHKWGRVTDANGDKVAKKNKADFTLKQIQEAREVSDRAYQIGSQDAQSGEEGEETYERAGSPLTITEDMDHNSVDERDLARSRLAFFDRAFLDMRIGSRQKEIILRTFGLAPYSHEQSQKEIIAETGYPSRFVKEVIMAFSIYLPQPGGVFHKILLDTPADTIEELELTWVLLRVGEWPSQQRTPTGAPDVLTQPGMRVK